MATLIPHWPDLRVSHGHSSSKELRDKALGHYVTATNKFRVLLGRSESVSCSIMSDSATPWTVALQSPLSMEFSR